MQNVYYDTSAENRNIYQSTITIGAVILVTTMIKLFQRWVHDNERINELNNTTLTMELSGLRNQINPHFLFNMLNGIKALVQTIRERKEKKNVLLFAVVKDKDYRKMVKTLLEEDLFERIYITTISNAEGHCFLKLTKPH